MTQSLTPTSGLWRQGCHLLPVRVHWENTDAGGIVYHAEYLKFAERARTEMLRLAGIHQGSMLAGEGVGFAVAKLSIDYKRPAKLDDALVVETTLDAVGGAVLDLTQTIRREGDPLAILTVRVACLSLKAGVPIRIPAIMREKLVPGNGD
ncbi:4-hydroxybenzoyl-CoA thioesterase [Rhodospirillum rubrum]|uniref:tol-pal system-associated acyl-CoA thioesterase n=1 Tax=Rhodospirillum rubrum TaxID=1085 RepID=UPI001905F76E|nr:tol-pal system-associated acyl-CoA thioesterase [Rhodospirillum rubrum]MBK1665890.1 4-hydroxybenzoyl-CoA thioesterase [Rhodospirillum rubrum]MBK1676283.1 4-hydroxybenzoyl-CoA thioesterase [Rhodospirillum rubrum]